MLTLIAEVGTVPLWLDELVLLAIKLLGAALITLVGWATAKLAKKWGIEHTEAFERRGRLAAQQALNYADRWARQQSTTPDGDAKMVKALEYALTLPCLDATGEYISQLIESQLEAEAKANGKPT